MANKAPAKKATAQAKKSARPTLDHLQKQTPEQTQEAKRQALEEKANRRWEHQVTEAEKVLTDLEESVTQREWLLVTAGLDRTRDQIARDGSLRLLALGYVKTKRETGEGWDELLKMTDKELVRLHGFPDETPQEAQARLEANASPTPPEERNTAPETEQRVPTED